MTRIIFNGSFGVQKADECAIDYDIDYDYGDELDFEFLSSKMDSAEEDKIYSANVTDEMLVKIENDYGFART